MWAAGQKRPHGLWQGRGLATGQGQGWLESRAASVTGPGLASALEEMGMRAEVRTACYRALPGLGPKRGSGPQSPSAEQPPQSLDPSFTTTNSRNTFLELLLLCQPARVTYPGPSYACASGPPLFHSPLHGRGVRLRLRRSSMGPWEAREEGRAFKGGEAGSGRWGSCGVLGAS